MGKKLNKSLPISARHKQPSLMQGGQQRGVVEGQRCVRSRYFVILLLQLEKAYATASKNLLQLLIADNDLIGHLKSVKHYFLLDQGEFEDSKLAFLFLKYPFASLFIFAIIWQPYHSSFYWF